MSEVTVITHSSTGRIVATINGDASKDDVARHIISEYYQLFQTSDIDVSLEFTPPPPLSCGDYLVWGTVDGFPDPNHFAITKATVQG